MVVIDEKMAQFWGCEPQTYGDLSDPTGGGVGRRYTHFLHDVLQTMLNVGQCDGGVQDAIVLEYCFDFFRKSRALHKAKCLLQLGFCYMHAYVYGCVRASLILFNTLRRRC